MHNRSRLFIVIAITFLSLPGFSQINTNSPYSRFGVGLVSNDGFGQNIALGGTGIGVDAGGRINYLNPASYSSIDTMSFLFDFGINGMYTNFTQGSEKSMMGNMNIDHLSIGFPITRWMKAAAGITPFSSVGYNIVEETTIPELGLVDYFYEGNGGLSRLFVGTSVKFLDHFSVGTNMSYMFGYIENTSRVDFPADNSSAITQIQNRMVVGDILWNFGAQFNYTFKNKYFITLGAILDNETKLNTSNSLINVNYFPGSTGELDVYEADTVSSTIPIYPSVELSRSNSDGHIIYPRNLGIGFSTGIRNKLLFAADYSTQEWSKSVIPRQSNNLINSDSWKFGLEYIPNSEAIRGYYNHMRYRLGGYYTNTYLSVGSDQVKDYGITFGVGLPLKGMKSTLNLGFVLGQRGNLNNNLIKENYGIFNLSLTLHDYWFIKRQFD